VGGGGGGGGGSIRMDCRIREVFLLSIDITPQVTVLIYIGVCSEHVEKTKKKKDSTKLQRFIPS